MRLGSVHCKQVFQLFLMFKNLRNIFKVLKEL
jgi:hypothetical protein